MAGGQKTKDWIRIKIISMGAAETGKSCLIKRYCEKRFVSSYMATLGIDFGVTKVKTNKGKAKVNIFDLAGQPFFAEVYLILKQATLNAWSQIVLSSEVRNEFYKDTQGAMLVYDVTNRESFDSLNVWLREMRTNLDSPADLEAVAFVVCANKVDLGRRQVEESEGRLWAEAKGFSYFETSALSGENVQEMFDILFHSTVDVVVTGIKPGLALPDLPYTPEQVAMVSRIRRCKDGYQMLGLSKNCSKEEVNKAYKHLAVLLHPDKNLSPGSDEAFKRISSAREDILKSVR